MLWRFIEPYGIWRLSTDYKFIYVNSTRSSSTLDDVGSSPRSRRTNERRRRKIRQVRRQLGEETLDMLKIPRPIGSYHIAFISTTLSRKRTRVDPLPRQPQVRAAAGRSASEPEFWRFPKGRATPGLRLHCWECSERSQTWHGGVSFVVFTRRLAAAISTDAMDKMGGKKGHCDSNSIVANIPPFEDLAV
jgi:hypothetical protein